MRYLLLALAVNFFVFTKLYSQDTDTIKIFQYNLLNYGASDNPVSYKNPRLQTIIDYCNPDIFGANEIANGSQHAQTILNSVLGAEWDKGSYVNSNNSVQTNMLFWKKNKFGLSQQQSIASLTRDIIAYKLYYKDPALVQTHDTTFLTVIVAHLKAGDNQLDALDRTAEVAVVMDYLDITGSPSQNYIFMGDLNVYYSNEDCYKLLMGSNNGSVRFYDPINRPGDWSTNSSFADIHSQSTRKIELSDGGVTGGLDDRFDQILISDGIRNNARRIEYLPGSYHIVAQDGNHYNKALTEAPQNTSVPSNVLQALYEMSDHLPVMAKFLVKKVGGGTSVSEINDLKFDEVFTVINPVRNNAIKIVCSDIEKAAPSLNVSLYKTDGSRILHVNWNVASNKEIIIPASFSTGLYLLRIIDNKGQAWVTKLIVP